MSCLSLSSDGQFSTLTVPPELSVLPFQFCPFVLVTLLLAGAGCNQPGVDSSFCTPQGSHGSAYWSLPFPPALPWQPESLFKALFFSKLADMLLFLLYFFFCSSAFQDIHNKAQGLWLSAFLKSAF